MLFKLDQIVYFSIGALNVLSIDPIKTNPERIIKGTP